MSHRPMSNLHVKSQVAGKVACPERPAFPGACLASLTLLWSFLFPDQLHAVQTHGAPEGLYAHQMGHAAFLGAMGYIWFRTRARWGPGWRLIRLSFLFFALWNINTFLVHAVEASLPASPFQAGAGGPSPVFTPRSPLEVFFYFGKMDHLLCAPAALMLGLGLRRLRRSGSVAGHGP